MIELQPHQAGFFAPGLIDPDWRWFWDMDVIWLGPSPLTGTNASNGGPFVNNGSPSTNLNNNRRWVEAPLGPALEFAAEAIRVDIQADFSRMALPYTIIYAYEVTVPLSTTSLRNCFSSRATTPPGWSLSMRDPGTGPEIWLQHSNATPAIRQAWWFTNQGAQERIIFSLTVRSQNLLNVSAFMNGVKQGAPSTAGSGGSGTFAPNDGTSNGRLGNQGGQVYIAGVINADWSDDQHLQFHADPLGPLRMRLPVASGIFRSAVLLTGGAGAAELAGLPGDPAIGLMLNAGLGYAEAEGLPGDIAAGAQLSLGMGAAEAEGLPGDATIGLAFTAGLGAAEFAGLPGDAAAGLALDAGIGAVAAEGLSGQTAIGLLIAAGLGAIEAAGLTGDALIGLRLSAGLGAADIEGLPGDAAAGIRLAAGMGAADIEGLPGDIVTQTYYLLGLGAIDAAGLPGDLAAGARLALGLGAADITGQPGDLAAGLRLSAGLGAVDASGLSGDARIGIALTAGMGAAHVLGLPGDLASGLALLAGLGEIELDGFSGDLTMGLRMALGVGAIDATGLPGDVLTGPAVLGIGSITIDGLAGTINVRVWLARPFPASGDRKDFPGVQGNRGFPQAEQPNQFPASGGGRQFPGSRRRFDA